MVAKDELYKNFPVDLPLVILDPPMAGGVDACVASDQQQGAKLSRQGLAAVGVKKIGLFTGPSGVSTHRRAPRK